MKKRRKLSMKRIRSFPKLRAPAGYIYVIQDVEVSFRCKIGKTNYPSRRLLNEHGPQLPFEFETFLIKEVSDASVAELLLHQRFRKSRVKKRAGRSKRPEWFDLDESQITLIDSLDLNAEAAAWSKKKKVRSTKQSKIRRKPVRRQRQIKDTGWSERDWTAEEWLNADSEIDSDIDYDGWDLETADEQDWETEDTDVDLPEGDIEDTIEFENLSGKNLAGMILSAKDLSYRDLSFANLWGTELSYTYFVNCDLTEVDFTDADMNETDLRQANLMNANLTGASLRGASLANASLQGANLTSADLSKAVLTGVMYDEFTILPNGELWSEETDIARFTR